MRASTIALAVAVLLVAACSEDVDSGGPTDVPVVPSPPVISVSPGSMMVPSGRSRAAVLEEFSSSTGAHTLTADHWSSSDESVATVDGAGVVTGHTVGSVTISATRGDKSFSAQVTVPPEPKAIHFVAIATGTYRQCGLDDSGIAWCWGKVGPISSPVPLEQCERFSSYTIHAATQYVRSSESCSIIPIQMSDRQFVSIRNGGDDPYVLTAEGEAFAVTGSGVTAIAPTEHFKSISYRTYSLLCALRPDSSGVCGGNNSQGEMGIGVGQDLGPYPAFPKPVSVLGQLKQIEPGSCALTLSGEAFCWGMNADFRLGIGPDSTIRSGCRYACATVPTAVLTSTRFSSIAVADDICGISVDGDTWCWGPLPFHSPIPHETAGRPVKVGSLQFKSLSNQTAICGIAMDDYAYCLKKSAGATTIETLFSFEKLALPFHSREVSVGEYFGGCALSADDGRVYCWGDGIYGRLGNATATGAATAAAPVEVFGQGPPAAGAAFRRR